jgi:hypothetical protein
MSSSSYSAKRISAVAGRGVTSIGVEEEEENDAIS